jgi:hypothetical protein
MRPGGNSGGRDVRRAASAVFVTIAAAAHPALAQPPGEAAQHLAALAEADAALKAVIPEIPECEAGCLTPGEATVMAFAAGEGAGRPGRFVLDIRGGGQSLHGELGELLFVNSRRDYATLGTLTVAFDHAALDALLRRPRGCGASDVVEGQITVKACRTAGVANLDMFTMMQALGGRRILVEGEVRMQWIDSALGSPRPLANKRGEHEVGYYQVWVHVTDAAQVIFVDAP